MDSPQKLYDKFHSLLELKRHVVGVKFFDEFNIEEYSSYSGIEVIKPIAYCVAVKSAMSGHSVKIRKDMSGCAGSSCALGFTTPNDGYFSGEQGEKMGLFKDRSVASKVNHDLPVLGNASGGTLAAVIKPLYAYENEGDPDIVLVISDSFGIMRILEGYTYIYGLPHGLCASGNRAVCTECSVLPLKTHSINISFLCAGTRYRCKWGNAEIMCGFPFSMADGIAKGILETVNAVETDERKKLIEKHLIETDNLETEIKYGETYYQKKQK